MKPQAIPMDRCSTIQAQESATSNYAEVKSTREIFDHLLDAEQAIRACLDTCDPNLPTDREAQVEALELTVVMPCLNEADTLGTCIEKAQRAMRAHNIQGEVVVADNGSTDQSREIATRLGARVVGVRDKGYGCALMGGIQAARGQLIVMGDADDSYDFLEIPKFVDKLRQGYDLVMGNRFQGGIQKGAMPPLHKYLGNPVLTGIGRIFFRCPSRDFHCGLRGFSAAAIRGLDLQTTGMEFASEMVVKSTLSGLRITEIPTILSPDGRSRPPHLRSFRDGWRHLRFMLLYSPRWLFLIPGLLVMVLGLLGYCLALPAITLGGVTLGIHTLLVSSLAILLGYQVVQFALFAKIFAISENLMPIDRKLDRLSRIINLEHGLLLGSLAFAVGLGLLLTATNQWRLADFGPLNNTTTMRWLIPGVTLAALGFQSIFSSFFVSILRMARR